MNDDIFGHHLFTYGRPPFSRGETWYWLITEATRKRLRHRRSRPRAAPGLATGAGGRMALASHSGVSFLHRLESEGMVVLSYVPVCKTGTRVETSHERSRHIITILNYKKFQRYREPGQGVRP